MKLCWGGVDGSQLICREICCFVHWAKKNILQAKEKWLEPIHYGAAIFFLYNL